MSESELLRRAAQRAASRPFFLAAPLLAYARAEGLDDAGLAEYLGCEPATLAALLLCRRPSGQPAAFRADLQRIAERFQLDPARLAAALRVAAAIDTLSGSSDTASGGLLAAARDRDDSQDPQP